MFFARIGYLVAIFVLLIGIWNVAGGLMIATGAVGPYEAALERYFPSASSSGEVIDKGLRRVLIGIALGVLTEIAFSIAKLPDLWAKRSEAA
jgi:hypothetical protein